MGSQRGSQTQNVSTRIPRSLAITWGLACFSRSVPSRIVRYALPMIQTISVLSVRTPTSQRRESTWIIQSLLTSVSTV